VVSRMFEVRCAMTDRAGDGDGPRRLVDHVGRWPAEQRRRQQLERPQSATHQSSQHLRRPLYHVLYNHGRHLVAIVAVLGPLMLGVSFHQSIKQAIIHSSIDQSIDSPDLLY